MTNLSTISLLFMLMSVVGTLLYRWMRLNDQRSRLQPKAIPIKSTQEMVNPVKRSETDSLWR